MGLAATIRLIALLLSACCLGWMIFAITIHEDPEDAMAVAHITPVIRRGVMGADGRIRPLRSPAPVIKPAGRESVERGLCARA